MAAVAKAALKAAKSALDAQKYAETINQASQVLSADPKNYFAHLFLGRAHEKQGDTEAATKAYEAATKLKPEDELAWKGLCAVCESQGSKAIGRYIPAALGLAQVYAEKSDLEQCQTIIDKLTGFVKLNGSRQEYKEALKVLLPSGPVYDFLGGRLQPPALTYTRLAEITESEETERINKEIGERRTRLGAKLGQVKAEVTREVFAKSELESLYRSVIDWTSDDEIRRNFEEKLLHRAYNHLLALAQGDKQDKRDQVVKLAHEMVIIKHPYRLAWDLELEWRDVEDIASLDKGILREFIAFFPSSGIAKILQAYQGQVLKPKDKRQVPGSNIEDDEYAEAGDKDDEIVSLSTEDRLLLLSEGADDARDSYFAHRLTAEYYLQIEEYESSAEASRRALGLVAIESQKCGLRFHENVDAMKTCLGTCLVYYQSPKNHPEAQDLFNDVLSRKPNSTASLLGIGLVYEEQEQYDEAASFLERALQRDPENVRIGAEASWCRAQTGELEGGLQQLQTHYEKLASQRGANLDLRALIAYRIGKCIWALRKDKASRKDRKGAYAYFLAAVKANPNLAPPYTGLGLYYADYAKDKKRARQCFQKAFELSSTEVKAAERLARSFADDSEWDIVEIVAQRTIDSGIVRPAPGSRKKGISWPFAAMGVVQMNKQEYPAAVVSFQAALRISPRDYNSWVGLGESYHSSGRYNAAKRALEYAVSLRDLSPEDIPEDAWFADYMLANVHRELGEFEEALQGYHAVLRKRPQEFGVSIALLQTLVERSEHSLTTGFFGQAAQGAKEAIDAAATMDHSYRKAFNFWKAVGDACMIFSWIPNRIDELPTTSLSSLLVSLEPPKDKSLADVNKVFPAISATGVPSLRECLGAAVKAHAESIEVSGDDFHALAVGWYNLGWTQYRASTLQDKSETKTPTRLAKQAVRSFKRAIELEAGNADYWNALGVVTTPLNAKVAQHSFVRSLHLNERSARTWTNLGTLYLLQNDQELAHQAFSRAQSTDPEYPYAWLGEGMIALLVGDTREALSHFTHAVDIADASATVIKAQYLSTVFDHILQTPSTTAESIASLVTPMFVAQQLQSLAFDVTPYRQLLALLHERMGDYSAAVALLETACTAAEAAYETTESPAVLAQYIRAKADLARNQLAAHAFADAIENAEMAITLSDLDDPANSDAQLGLAATDRTKCRLSAQLTAGLAYYAGNPPDRDAAVARFRAALAESNGAPDVVCLLAQMLWASGDAAQRDVAREQLFATIEAHAGHVGATTLLGAIALVEGDDETLRAVTDDLQGLRTDAALTPAQGAKVERLLGDIAAVQAGGGEKAGVGNAEVYRKIMLHPASPLGWAGLAAAAAIAQSTGVEYVAQLAAKTAQGSVPPRGLLGAEELAKAYAGTGRAIDAQRSIMAAPWMRGAWDSLREGIGF